MKKTTSPSNLGTLLTIAACSALCTAFIMHGSSDQTVADSAFSQGGGLFHVVESEGPNLIVTDNRNNTLYFYTFSESKTDESSLKLQGSIDLNLVGQLEIIPMLKNK